MTNGGPVVVLPGIYATALRQDVLFWRVPGIPAGAGHDAVFPVPTVAERQGIDTTTFP